MKTPPLLDEVTDGAFIILPTSAAAHALRRSYDDRQRAQGLGAWQSADIFSWQQFLNHLWSQAVVAGADFRLLLNAAQEHSLWLEVIEAKPSSASPASFETVSTLAAQAWSLANAYACVKRLSQTAHTHDTRAFAAWAADFERLCEQEKCLSAATLESVLAHHIADGAIGAPPTLHLVGFDEFTPAQKHLLDALHAAGVAHPEHTLRTDSAARSVYIANDEAEELQAIAQHVRARLEHQPDARIAVLLPDAAEFPQVDAMFRAVLAPELEYIDADLSSAPWQAQYKGALTAQAIVAATVRLLNTVVAPQPLQTITDLLLSPYLGDAPDQDAAARFDADTLRHKLLLRPELDLTGLHRIGQTSAKAPTWIRRVATLLASANLTSQRSFADWAAFARTVLHTAQWPGPRNLTSVEFQATEAFDSLLDTLSTLDFRGRRTTLTQFVSALTKLVSSTTFTPAPTFAPVQVLPIAAALAQQFDMVILARATEANYPSREEAHPLLSFALQASLDMPGARVESAARRAQSTLTQLLSCADGVLLTCARKNADGPQRFSPLLESLAHPRPIDIAVAPVMERITAVSFTDEAALPPLPSVEVTGGASVLKLQAACGFLAFAELRLRAARLETSSPGLNAMQSGDLLHRALERFWKQVETQENLRNLSPQELRDALRHAIAGALPPGLIAETEWEKAYVQLQQYRLLQVLTTWMQTELKRGPFTVLASEQKELITVGPLTLSIRMDRIDQVDGGHVFVDYKTGAAGTPKQWTGDRPDEPQLPLYALLSEPGELKALAFARVRAGKENKWTGYQAESGILPVRDTRDIDAEIEQWRATLTALAEDFAAGVVDVNPKSFAVNCKHCGQRLLCRVNPESFLEQQAADEEDALTGEAAE